MAALGALIVFSSTTNAAAQDHEWSHLWVESGAAASDDGDTPIRWSSISKLAEKISPAVVNIIVSYHSGDGLEDFFNTGNLPNAPSAQGTGFIIHPSGYFLTNNHVIEGAESVKVRLFDDRELEAKVVGTDPETDIALMKIRDDGEFPTVVLGDSDDVHVGENVLAIGNPLGLSHTVTAGIVSALGRRNLAPEGRDIYADFIQTDASINPGNSGGPLISLQGEVIAINTAVNRQGQGIGFAIPINIVKSLIPQLHKHGYVVRTWLGIRIQEVTPTLARSFGLDKARGALVTEVVDDSPADTAGLKAGDVILKFGDHRIDTSDKLPWLASTGGAGNSVDIELMRGGDKMTLEALLEKSPNQKRPQESEKEEETEENRSVAPRDIGVAVKGVGESLARQLGAKTDKGVVVTKIMDSSPARSSGLRRRDVITEVGDAGIRDKDDFKEAVDTFRPGEVVRFKVIRGGRVVYIAFER